ncbi:MAG: ATP-dependent sacrificial sulfur transferase LarE, partial [bacterium]
CQESLRSGRKMNPVGATPTTRKKYERLLARIREFPSALVAFSGGLDSGFVLHAAKETFAASKKPLLAAMTLSPAVPEWDRLDAKRIADELKVPLRFIDSDIIEHTDYIENSIQRCYFCKSDLYERLEELRRAESFAVIFNGTQADDLSDFRPGLKAAAEHRVVSPLADAGLRKDELRSLARQFGLSFRDKPGSPCLASRIPHGTPVTLDALNMVHRAEAALRAIGLRVVRVRHLGAAARVELGADEHVAAGEEHLRSRIESELRVIGYQDVSFAPYAPSGQALLRKA